MNLNLNLKTSLATCLILASFLLPFHTQAQKIPQLEFFSGTGVQGNKDGIASEARFYSYGNMCQDSAGNIYLAENHGCIIRKIAPDGSVTTIAGGTYGTDDGNGKNAQFLLLGGICVDRSGNLYVTEAGTEMARIRKIAPDGTVTVLAGGENGYVDGNVTAARFYYPRGICIDDTGNLYVADQFNASIRKIRPNGMVSTFATGFNNPFGLTIDKLGNLYLTEIGSKVTKVSPAGNVTLLAGGSARGYRDGLGSDALFNSLYGICVDDSGNVYTTDNANNRVRKITADGMVSTVIGNGDAKEVDGAGERAAIKGPRGILVNKAGDIFVCQEYPNKIRKITWLDPGPPACYFDIPGSLCMGSTLNATPATTNQVALQLINDSVYTSAPKAICEGSNGEYYVLNANDSILRYSANGSLLQVINDMQIVSAIVDITELNGRIYAIGNSGQTNSVYRFNLDGSADIGYSSPQFYFSGPVAIEAGPDGYIYVSDTLSGNIDKMDTNTGTASFYAGPFEGVYNVTDMAFGRNDVMYLVSKNDQKILSRPRTSSSKFTNLIAGLDTMQFGFDKMEMDTSGSDYIVLSSSSTGKVVLLNNGYQSVISGGLNMGEINVMNYHDAFSLNQPSGLALGMSGSGVPILKVANKGGDNLKSIGISMFSISPALPEGLSFDFVSGRITGTPKEPSPAATYTVSVTNEWGTSTTQISFSVDPPGPVSNSTGEKSSGVKEHADGLTVNYFEKNNCAEMLAIEDETGGTSIGKVEVTQTVFPTIATFSTGTFVPRVNEISTQDPNAQARLKFYYTFLDIEHYNQSNGTDPDLLNDTAGGTMQVGVIQLHTDSIGRTEQIKHNPVDAFWSRSKQAWVIDFQVDKFSTFYVGETSVIDAFDCSNAGATQTITSCGSYFWRGIERKQSGIYTDITVNSSGCDSLLTLDLTVVNDFEIAEEDGVLTCNTPGASYQWLNCDSGYSVIQGATAQTFTPQHDGNYAVAATKNSCTDTSSCLYVDSVNSTGLQRVMADDGIRIYPNPSNGVFIIEAEQVCTLVLTSMQGKQLGTIIIREGRNTVDLGKYEPGIYILSGDRNKHYKLVMRH